MIEKLIRNLKKDKKLVQIMEKMAGGMQWEETTEKGFDDGSKPETVLGVFKNFDKHAALLFAALIERIVPELLNKNSKNKPKKKKPRKGHPKRFF